MTKTVFVFLYIVVYNEKNKAMPEPGGCFVKKGISQEGLKLIACVTMLIDHVGYELIYPIYSSMSLVSATDLPVVKLIYNMYLLCRCIGRISFPIFAFLLVEGIHHTRNRVGYALRLAIGMFLAEIPYDLVVAGEISWQKQSIMVTLLLGFCAVILMEKCRSLAWKPVVLLPVAVLAEVLHVSYGWEGILLIALFELSREMYNPNLVRTGGMIVLFHYMSSSILRVRNFTLPMQVLGVLSMLFIANYDGRKMTHSKILQWGFYLFYPVHLLILWIIGQLISGVFMMGISIAI